MSNSRERPWTLSLRQELVPRPGHGWKSPHVLGVSGRLVWISLVARLVANEDYVQNWHNAVATCHLNVATIFIPRLLLFPFCLSEQNSWPQRIEILSSNSSQHCKLKSFVAVCVLVVVFTVSLFQQNRNLLHHPYSPNGNAVLLPIFYSLKYVSMKNTKGLLFANFYFERFEGWVFNVVLKIHYFKV